MTAKKTNADESNRKQIFMFLFIFKFVIQTKLKRFFKQNLLLLLQKIYDKILLQTEQQNQLIIKYAK